MTEREIARLELLQIAQHLVLGFVSVENWMRKEIRIADGGRRNAN